jgi:hypothetical protein
MLQTEKWTYNPETRVITISQNGEFNLQIGEANWVVIKVEVGSASTTVQEEGRQEAQ